RPTRHEPHAILWPDRAERIGVLVEKRKGPAQCGRTDLAEAKSEQDSVLDPCIRPPDAVGSTLGRPDLAPVEGSLEALECCQRPSLLPGRHTADEPLDCLAQGWARGGRVCRPIIH